MYDNKYLQYFIIILTFLILACISDICIIHTHVLFNANDMMFHLKRVYELYNGNYFSPFAINYFHGSAVMGIYPFISVLPLVFLLHITSSYLYAYYYFFILIIFATLLISFFSSLKFSKSKATSYLFAALYSLSVALLINYFHDGDLGITTSLVFLPLVIFGILDVLNESGGYIKLSLGLTFMAYCQLPTTIIAGLFIILLILININKINKLIFYNLLKSVLLTVLLTSIVWIPFLKIILFNKITTPTSSQIQSANIVSIIKNVGFLPILSIFALPFYFKKFSRYVKQMYCLSVVIIIVASSYVPLIRLIASIKFFHFINTFQFTARFLIIPQVILCYLASWLIVKWISHFNEFNFSFVGIIILILLSQFAVQMFVVHNEFNQKYLYADSYRSIRVFRPVAGHYMIKKPWMKYLLNGYMNNSDYYPAKSIPKQKYIVNNEAIYGHDRTINVKHTGYNRFSFNSSKKINWLALPLLHYNGEHLRVDVNHHSVHYHINKNRLITLDNVKQGRNAISVKYVPNMWIVVLKSVLFVIGMVWLLLILFKYLENKFMKRNILLSSSIILTIVLGIIYAFIKGGWSSIISLIINILIAAIFYLLGQTTLSKRVSQDYIITLKYNIIPKLYKQIKKYRHHYEQDPFPRLPHQEGLNNDDVINENILQNQKFIFTPVDIWSYNLCHQINIGEISPKDVFRVRNVLQKLYNKFKVALIYAEQNTQDAEQTDKANHVSTSLKGNYYNFKNVKRLLDALSN